VVDGKDGVMPQTRECVDTIVKAGMPVVVAVTKADICPDRAAAVEAVGKQLLELGLATEDFGGDAPAVAVSAKVRGGGRQQQLTSTVVWGREKLLGWGQRLLLLQARSIGGESGARLLATFISRALQRAAAGGSGPSGTGCGVAMPRL